MKIGGNPLRRGLRQAPDRTELGLPPEVGGRMDVRRRTMVSFRP